MNKLCFHHVSIAVEELKRARQFYADVLEMQELDRPDIFGHPEIWYKIGDDHDRRNSTSWLRARYRTSFTLLASVSSMAKNKPNRPLNQSFQQGMRSSERWRQWQKGVSKHEAGGYRSSPAPDVGSEHGDADYYGSARNGRRRPRHDATPNAYRPGARESAGGSASQRPGDDAELRSTDRDRFTDIKDIKKEMLDAP